MEGTLGTRVGADLLNLGRVRELDAPCCPLVWCAPSTGSGDRSRGLAACRPPSRVPGLAARRDRESRPNGVWRPCANDAQTPGLRRDRRVLEAVENVSAGGAGAIGTLVHGGADRRLPCSRKKPMKWHPVDRTVETRLTDSRCGMAAFARKARSARRRRGRCPMRFSAETTVVSERVEEGQ